MRIKGVSLVLGLWLGLGAAHAATLKIAPDRMAVANGERTFILGLYEYPKTPETLQQAAEAGFNLINVSDERGLDALSAAGIWGWMNTGMNLDLSESTAERTAALGKMVGTAGKHSALLVWEVPDEALWNCWYGAQQWRWGEEPKQLRALIDALTDKALAESLNADLAQSRTLRSNGEWAAAEQLADGIWQKLGKTSPMPGYGLSNAAERAAKMCGGMEAGYARLRALDPEHPVWMNHAPRNQIAQLAAFDRAADIVGCDIYPVPFAPEVGHSDLAERTAAAVGAYTDRMQEAAPGKPVWMVLQGFGWGDIQPEKSEAERKKLRRPTLEESRFMAYDAIVHGARGLLYWGTAYIEKDSTLWADLLTLARELKGLQPVLSAEDAQLPVSAGFEPTLGSVDRGIRVLPKSVGGKVWFIVVNEFTDALQCRLTGLASLEGAQYADTQTGRQCAVAGGLLRLPIRGQSVQVLRPE